MQINTFFIFDIHGHPPKTIPFLLKLLHPSTPKDVSLADFSRAGLNGGVVSVLGDPNSFRPFKIDSYKYVLKALSLLKKMIPDDFVVIKSTDDFNERIISTPDPHFRAFVLGIEGGDFIETDLNRLDEVFNRGVRLMTLVHFSNNTIGHRCMDLKGKENDSSKGLTDFGENVVKKMNALGMIIDLAHCNEKTANDVIDLSKKPVVASHTGPRALQDFPRYISDDLMLRISKNGGVVGIWPFFKNGLGIKDLNEFAHYAKYIADLIGIDHISIGTDINGVPSNMKGYKNIFDYERILQSLKIAGFSDDDISKITGVNFFRVVRKNFE